MELELSMAEWEAVGDEESSLVCLSVLWDFFNYYFQRNATTTTKGLKYSTVKTIDLKRKTKT